MMSDFEEADIEPDDDTEEADSTLGRERLVLSFEETRVLGCLLEKESTTPDHYPLTENQLMSACNQSSSREPVTAFEMGTIKQAMEDLRYKGLGILVRQAGARVAKFKHTIENKFVYLDKPELALLTVLMLRGQQTIGELRQRTERMHHFSDLDAAHASMDKLIEYDPFPLAKSIPSGGGRRAETFVHLLSGDVEVSDSPISAAAPVVTEAVVAGPTWREEMEEEIAALKTTVEELKGELATVKTELGI